MYTLPQVNKRPTPSRRFVLPRSGPRACATHGVSGVEKTCGQKKFKIFLRMPCNSGACSQGCKVQWVGGGPSRAFAAAHTVRYAVSRRARPSNAHPSNHRCRRLCCRSIMRPPLLAMFLVYHLHLLANASPLSSIGEIPSLPPFAPPHGHHPHLSPCFVFRAFHPPIPAAATAQVDGRVSCRRPSHPPPPPPLTLLFSRSVLPPVLLQRVCSFATLRNDFSPESSSCCAITSSPGIASSPSVACFFDAEEEGVMVMER